jgi:hypothetical protein
MIDFSLLRHFIAFTVGALTSSFIEMLTIWRMFLHIKVLKKRPFERPKEDNIKLELNETGCTKDVN